MNMRSRFLCAVVSAVFIVAVMSPLSFAAPRSDVILKSSPSNVLWYIPDNLHAGIAARTDVTDLTTYIQYAIDNAAASASMRGELLFPDGLYNYGSQLNLNQKRNVVMRGSRVNSGAAPIGAELRYTGGGAAPAINAGRSYGIVFRGLTMTYTDPTFTGYLLSLAGVAGSGTQKPLVEDCALYGANGAKSSTGLIALNHVYHGEINNNLLMFADVGIRGGWEFSSSIAVTRNLFQLMNVTNIYDSGQAWDVSKNVFEPLNNGSGGYGNMSVYKDSGAGAWAQAVVFEKNWIGDTVADNTATGAYFEITGAGVSIKNNFIALVPGVKGVNITQNGMTGFEASGNSVTNDNSAVAPYPTFLYWTTVGHGAFRIGPNMIWGDNTIVEVSGTMPKGSIYQTNDYDVVNGNKGKVLIGNTDMAAGIARIVHGEKEWDATGGFLDNNGVALTTLTVTGAERPDHCFGSWGGTSIAGMSISAHAIDTDNVAVSLHNISGAGIGQPIQTLRVNCWKN